MQHSLFDQPRRTFAADSGVDYHILPATEKQVMFARHLAARAKAELPDEIVGDRQRLSRWIDAHKQPQIESRYAAYPSSKQVGFAERIARTKRRPIPPECFRDKALMSKWIDANR